VELPRQLPEGLDYSSRLTASAAGVSVWKALRTSSAVVSGCASPGSGDKRVSEQRSDACFATGRATGRTPASRHGRQSRATRHACAVAQTGASACAWCSPGSGALRFLTAVRLPLAAAGCEHSRWIATVESRDAVLLVAPLRLSVVCPGPSGCCYSRRQQRGQALVSSHLRRLLGLAHAAARNGSTVGRAAGPVARILNPSPNATNGTVCHEAGGGRRGLLVLIAGPLRYSSIGDIPPSRWLRPYLIERAGVVSLLLPRYPQWGTGRAEDHHADGPRLGSA
jgi:hypothetical protein